jgi:hypothetical protein
MNGTFIHVLADEWHIHPVIMVGAAACAPHPRLA